MWESKQYRNALSGALKNSETEDRKELHESEINTPEYELAKNFKKLDELKNEEEKLKSESVSAREELEDTICPINKRLRESQKYEREFSKPTRAGFYDAKQINMEGFTTILRTVLDTNFREKMQALLTAADNAIYKHDEISKQVEVLEGDIRTQVKSLGGYDNLRDSFKEKIKALREYRDLSDKKKKALSEIIAEGSQDTDGAEENEES